MCFDIASLKTYIRNLAEGNLYKEKLQYIRLYFRKKLPLVLVNF